MSGSPDLLPRDMISVRAIALGMGFTDTAQFSAELTLQNYLLAKRKEIRGIYERLF